MLSVVTKFSKTLVRLPSVYRFSQQSKANWNLTEQEKANTVISKNAGLSKFLTRTYNTTAVALTGALSSGYLGYTLPFFAANPGMTVLGGIIGMFGGLLGTQFMKPKTITEYQLGKPIYRTENSAARLGLFGLGIFGLGLTASPLFGLAAAVNPSILPTAIAVSLGIFGGASMMAYRMPKQKMLGYGRILGGSLLGLIGIQLVGILSAFIMGPNPLSLMLFRADTYLGIALFTGFIAYDTHVAMKEYENGLADHLGMSVQFLLDVWNILVRVVTILINRE